MYDPNDPTQGLPAPFDPTASLGAILDDPRGRAALLSTGLAMTQPMAWGDNLFSQLGRAVGTGGEAIRQEEKLQQNQDLAEAKTQNLEARSEAARARSGQAGTNADIARERLGIAQQDLLRKQQMGDLQNQVRLSLAYQKYRADIKKDVLNPGQQPLEWNEWLASGAPGLEKFTRPAPDVGTGTVPAATSGDESLPTARQGDTKRAPGLYQTPQGVKRWTGSGWIER